MIDLKRCNYFTGDDPYISYGIKEIIDFMEVEGRNVLLVCTTSQKRTESTILNYLFSNHLEYNNFDDFDIILNTKGNLFRVDLLIFDFWHLCAEDIKTYKIIIDRLNIDHIILAKKYYYIKSDDIFDYYIDVDFQLLTSNNPWKFSASPPDIIITEKISGISSTFLDLKKSYVRDKKIGQIFNK